MDDLLTTKQVQELLQVDRITIYRMLNDGRIKGVKIGSQWRFPQSEIDRLFGKDQKVPESEYVKESLENFLGESVNKVQEIFAGMIGIGVILVSLQGKILTEPTFSNPFCELMLSSSNGHEACRNSWQKIALHRSENLSCPICHAGLCYQRSAVVLDKHQIAWLVAGQFRITNPDPEEKKERLKRMALEYDIPLSQLTKTAWNIPVLTKQQWEHVQEWTPKVSTTIEAILYERSDFLDRLQRIANLSSK